MLGLGRKYNDFFWDYRYGYVGNLGCRVLCKGRGLFCDWTGTSGLGPQHRGGFFGDFWGRTRRLLSTYLALVGILWGFLGTHPEVAFYLSCFGWDSLGIFGDAPGGCFLLILLWWGFFCCFWGAHPEVAFYLSCFGGDSFVAFGERTRRLLSTYLALVGNLGILGDAPGGCFLLILLWWGFCWGVALVGLPMRVGWWWLWWGRYFFVIL